MMKGALVLWIQVLTIFVYVYCVEKDLVFMIDKSNSIQSFEFYQALDFTYNATKCLHVGPNEIHISVFLYDDQVDHIIDFVSDNSSLIIALSNITFATGGSTDTARTLDTLNSYFTIQRGSRPSADKAVVVITDGDFNDPISVRNAISRLRRNGITVYGVSLKKSEYDIHFLALEHETDKVFNVSQYMYACDILNKICPHLEAEATTTLTDKIKGVIAGTLSAFLLLLCLLLFLLFRKKFRNRKTAEVYPEEHDVIVGLPPQKTFIR